MKLEGDFKNHYFLCLTLSNPNILKTISNSSRVISEKNSFRRTILIFLTDPDVAIQSLSLTVFGNVKLENILCKIYRFVKGVIVQLTFQFKKCYTLSKVVKCDRKYMNDCCSLILYERQKKTLTHVNTLHLVAIRQRNY